MFRRVTGRVHDIQPDVPDLEAIAVFHESGTLVTGKTVLPARVAFVREIQRRAGLCAELAAARQKVRMDVRFGHMRDSDTLVARRLDVLIGVAVGIDDDGLAGDGAADQVAGLSQFGLEEAFHEHWKRIHATWRVRLPPDRQSRARAFSRSVSRVPAPSRSPLAARQRDCRLR